MYLDPQHWPCQISVQRSFTLFLTSRSPHIALQYCTGTTSQLHPLSAFHSSPFSSLYITFSLLNLVKLHNKTILVVKSIKETVGTADSRPQASRSLSSFTSPPFRYFLSITLRRSSISSWPPREKRQPNS